MCSFKYVELIKTINYIKVDIVTYFFIKEIVMLDFCFFSLVFFQ